jgi:hypothetical protein
MRGDRDHVAGVENVSLRIVLEAVRRQIDHLRMPQIDSPAIADQRVPLDHPVERVPLLPLRFEIADGGDSRPVVSLAAIVPDERVAGGAEHEHDPRMTVSRQVRRIVVP